MLRYFYTLAPDNEEIDLVLKGKWCDCISSWFSLPCFQRISSSTIDQVLCHALTSFFLATMFTPGCQKPCIGAVIYIPVWPGVRASGVVDKWIHSAINWILSRWKHSCKCKTFAVQWKVSCFFILLKLPGTTICPLLYPHHRRHTNWTNCFSIEAIQQ